MYGLLGRLLSKPQQPTPVGSHDYWMQVTALQADGIPFGFTTYRPPDVSGFYPLWYQQFVKNYGNIDDAPIGIPMGPRHFSINANPADWGR